MSQPTLWGHASRVPGRGWRGAVPPRSRRTPALRCGVRARPSCEPCPVAPDGAWPRRLRSRSMARAGAVHVRLPAIVGRRDLVGGVRAAAMTVRWSSGSAPATRFATAAPTARCPGSGAGSWGFKGGAMSPWPDRNVSHCVGWLRRIRSSPGTDAWNRRMTPRLARGRGGGSLGGSGAVRGLALTLCARTHARGNRPRHLTQRLRRRLGQRRLRSPPPGSCPLSPRARNRQAPRETRSPPRRPKHSSCLPDPAAQTPGR